MKLLSGSDNSKATLAERGNLSLQSVGLSVLIRAEALLALQPEQNPVNTNCVAERLILSLPASGLTWHWSTTTSRKKRQRCTHYKLLLFSSARLKCQSHSFSAGGGGGVEVGRTKACGLYGDLLHFHYNYFDCAGEVIVDPNGTWKSLFSKCVTQNAPKPSWQTKLCFLHDNPTCWHIKDRTHTSHTRSGSFKESANRHNTESPEDMPAQNKKHTNNIS